jgi:hypothetical protein
MLHQIANLTLKKSTEPIDILSRRIVIPLIDNFGESCPMDPRLIGYLFKRQPLPRPELIISHQFTQPVTNHS